MLRSDAFSSRIAGVNGFGVDGQFFTSGLPVATYRVFATVSTAIDPQTPPPTHPLGTTVNAFSSPPVRALSLKICPRVVFGQLAGDATPI